MFKKLFFSAILVFCFLLLSRPIVEAFDGPHFVSFVNPIRGMEDWGSIKQLPLDLPRYQYQKAKEHNFPVNWLLRYDAVNNATISSYFKTISATDSSQTLGAFFEITPQLTAKAGVNYSPGEYFFAANRVFLSGYDQPDRIKLIDAYMSSFFAIFGYYPQVIGAWHIDSYSLEYFQKHYSVITAVICDEQYTTDNYRLWGGYLGSPYFPSKNNFLVPAANRSDRIDIALTKWAARDPYSFYGEGGSSWYSFQVNDYALLNLKTKYFEDLLGVYSQNGFNEFTQINIGLENDYDIAQYQNEISATYDVLSKNVSKDNLKFISLSDFGQWMKYRYSFTNPTFFFKTDDVANRSPGTVYWYQNPFYRIGLKSVGGGTRIIDLRLYNPKEAEEYYLTRNIDRKLYSEINPIVDSVKYDGTALPLDINLEKAETSYDHWQVIFKESGKVLRLEPQQIIFNQLTAPILNTEEIKVKNSVGQTIWVFTPKLPFTGSVPLKLLVFVVIALIAVLVLLKNVKNRILITVGWLVSSISLATVWQSGFVYNYGFGLWGPNGHDAIFHLSLSEHFRNSPFSLMHPQIAGKLLQNYHFGFDWISGLISKVLSTSSIDLYFRYLPILLIIFLVAALSKLLTLWHFTKIQITLSFVFAFLAGSAGFIPSLIFHRGLFAGESFFWANQSSSLLLNPPFAFSLLLLIIFLILVETKKVQSLKVLILLSVIAGFLVQIKIYAFLLLMSALLIRRKFKLLFGVSLCGLLFILPSLSLNSSPFSLNPLWFPRSMFESFDRLYWPKLAQAWQTYENGGVLVKLVLVNLFALVVFFIGNLWIRLIGLYRLVTQKSSFLSYELTKYITLVGLVVPLVITQNVNPWNTIQFMYYSIFFLGIFTAAQVGDWLSKKKYTVIFVAVSLLLVLASLPTTVGTLKDYFTAQSASRISLTELRALDLLRRSERGVVVSPLTYNRYLPVIPDPKPLYVYASTAYISALSGQPEYLSDTINLDITGFDYQNWSKNILRLYRTHDPIWVKEFLTQNNIKYIYETPFDKLQIRSQDACLVKIFDSGEVNIYKYSCHE